MQDFETKRKNLFECLDAIADKNLKGTVLDQSEREKSLQKSKHIKRFKEENLNISKLRGKESIFKKPYLPIAKCLKPKVSPDYKVNPHKWTKYSLEDADISDRMNTTAAFAFLKDIENKKEREKIPDDEMTTNKLIFNKTASIKRALRIDDSGAGSEEKPKLKGSKVVMPEYAFGRKTDKKKRNRPLKRITTSQPAKELTLSHLMDDQDEDNDIT